ncbi:hypothetical protein BV20DRAFT_432924 [Pilatotrama ljubarskyi]|nr:hypothetical protein BV20DRAFT_432924 [Pilatotrama ljubarskyi]
MMSLEASRSRSTERRTRCPKRRLSLRVTLALLASGRSRLRRRYEGGASLRRLPASLLRFGALWAPASRFWVSELCRVDHTGRRLASEVSRQVYARLHIRRHNLAAHPADVDEPRPRRDGSPAAFV